MPEDDQKLARIRKLLAKAEDPGVTEAEADAFNTKAAELIARYGIDQAMLAADHETGDKIDQVRIRTDNPYSHDKAQLLSRIARPLRCRVVFHTSGKSVPAVSVVGFASDLQRVQLLYTSLLMQATSQLATVRPGGNWSYGPSVAAYRRTWLAGFSAAVHTRLVQAERQATQEHTSPTESGKSTALVLRDRNTLVEDAFNTAFPDLTAGRRRRLSGMGYRDGSQAGQHANLHGTGVGGTRRGIAN